MVWRMKVNCAEVVIANTGVARLAVLPKVKKAATRASLTCERLLCLTCFVIS